MEVEPMNEKTVARPQGGRQLTIAAAQMHHQTAAGAGGCQDPPRFGLDGRRRRT